MKANSGNPQKRVITKQENDGKKELRKALEMMNDVAWSRALPIKGMVMIVNKDGSHVLASTDGRIIVKGGDVFDGWNKNLIITEDNAKHAWLATLNSTLGIGPKDMSTYYMGDLSKDKPDIVVFIDPLSTMMNKPIFDEVRRLGDDIQAAFVMTPIINGKESAVRARQLWCAKDQELAFKYLSTGNTQADIETLENCDVSKIGATLAVVQFLQINRLPYFINKNGLHRKGKPVEIAKFITQTE